MPTTRADNPTVADTQGRRTFRFQLVAEGGRGTTILPPRRVGKPFGQRSDERAALCPDYIKDHVVPLACGGPDAPSNMQWQTKADAKAKDKWETKGCAR